MEFSSRAMLRTDSCRRGDLQNSLENLEEGTDPNISVREGANVLQATFSLV